MPARLERIKAVQLAVRAAAGATLALLIAGWLSLEFPIYAFLAAVIVTDLSPSETRRLGWQRIVATFIGAACGATFSVLLPSGILAVGFGVLITMLICSLIRMQQAAKVGGYICGIIQLTYGTEPWTYACYRFVETMLGIAVAWCISLVPLLVKPANPEGPPE